MQCNCRCLGCSSTTYNNVADGGIIISMMAEYIQCICSRIYSPDFVTAIPARNCIYSICIVIRFNKGRCSRWQYRSFNFSRAMIIESNNIWFQVKCTTPEKDRSLQVEIKPEFEIIITYIENMFSSNIDIKIWMRTKNI